MPVADLAPSSAVAPEKDINGDPYLDAEWQAELAQVRGTAYAAS